MAANILIIDDDEHFQKILELRLRSFFPKAVFVSLPSLTDARTFLADNSIEFDLVVLDQFLSDGKGLELLAEGWFDKLAVLAVSSDLDPNLPGATIQAGATYFLNKSQISEALFKPLMLGLVDRNRLQNKLNQAQLDQAMLGMVKTLVATLRHEINNPLGAVLGGAYLMREAKDASQQQKEAAHVVEASGKRIKHVLDQLCEAIRLQPMIKGQEKVFHIPGDKPWEE